MLVKVISGGQTGADIAALRAAKMSKPIKLYRLVDRVTSRETVIACAFYHETPQCLTVPQGVTLDKYLQERGWGTDRTLWFQCPVCRVNKVLEESK